MAIVFFMSSKEAFTEVFVAISSAEAIRLSSLMAARWILSCIVSLIWERRVWMNVFEANVDEHSLCVNILSMIGMLALHETLEGKPSSGKASSTFQSFEWSSMTFMV